ncbi:phosphonate C-P lyase system protein PhnL [Ramlibacter sp. H39-3-26]|uniref:phosphonate C-P lyase system protein PhnL n=1 Tax=Curvibacter soli TaxID=3031331 RepID=UPI0023DA842F|nr:phosphonate C-P lyase system protein PhnL [Ramlibacter sp. H39-3-26]MDF1484628.1 phosphonate C-P lyase system protein PhnL [Ramlibacter sp. H39-3-26]
MPPALLQLEGVSKHFTLHHQGDTELAVLDGVDLQVFPGECVVLDGPSGMGKSTLLKLAYGNYRASAGHVRVCPPAGGPIDLTQAAPRAVAALRRETIGYVSQFLRVIPRVPALDVVAQALWAPGDDAQAGAHADASQAAAREEAGAWLARLRIPPELWALPPATFSGGEQQRVNIARSLIRPRPLLLLDEPTASLDAANTQTVVALIREAVARGAGVLGVFHDPAVSAAVATRRVNVASFKRAA